MYGDWIEALGEPVPAGRRELGAEVAALGRLRAAVEAREARVLAAIDGLDDSGPSPSAVHA